MTKGLAKTAAGAGATFREARPDDVPAVGSWWWVKEAGEIDEAGDDDETTSKARRWLGCVTTVGSNYVEVRGPSTRYVDSQQYVRVHFNDLASLTPEPDAGRYIQGQIEAQRIKVGQLMGRVKELTSRLAIPATGVLTDGSETQALALRGQGEDPKAYKKALVLAKEKTLPGLFKEIELANKAMAGWMKATLIPLKAEADALQPAMTAIESRIFAVELYAGLVEEVVQITDGKPAPMDEPVHLFQRRAYMDEECLAQYEAGGMEFKDLPAFDRWLARPVNRDRLLPKPRCVVAFRVRRREKEREFTSFHEFIRFIFERPDELDKLTFLYLRNGEKLFRLNTDVVFDERLFPDLDAQKLTQGKLYANMFGGRVDGVITEAEYQEIVRRDAEREKKEKTTYYFHRARDYQSYTRDNVYFDDISSYVRGLIEKHNRVVLILQGLLDRSPVFHPHPPWRLWTEDGFRSALRLVYDDSRAFTTGEAPDFEAYRARLNKSLTVGSVTVGQEIAWEIVEAERENSRRARSWRRRDEREVKRYRPSGNPGPGTLAKVMKYSKKGCTYVWTRERTGRLTSFDRHYDHKSYSDRFPCHITIPTEKLLNVSAYTPGDFKIFFSDPRTRADYLKWAPLLLEAEEFHAGNRKVGNGEDAA